MKKLLMATMLLGIFTYAQASDNWSDLWRNSDQQGEALLQQGNAKAAATKYSDPQRKAYAELKSGDYAAASHSYTALKGNDARYNQGNALAYLGDLQGALNAYDAVLKVDPNNRDARHNRDLVANAMKQQEAQQKKSDQNKKQDGQSKDDKQQGQNGADKNNSGQGQQGPGQSGDRGKDQPKDGHGQQKNSGEKNQSDQGKSGTANQNAAPAPDKSGQGGKPDDSAAGKSAANQAAAQPGNSGAADSAAKSAPNSPANSQQPGSQAENSALQDAMASLGKGQSGASAGKTGSATGSAAAPVSEQQIAQDQWLRAIPDDPGGLLKRKFLIEHMMRQQKEQP